uniref:Spermatogenesis-associated protein 20 n=1 Tax=Phallusia mammillata TaxID=59560 RepID=A0A6F9DU69_9ASCI|nr:spermatogenesis-associated protein 20 [Phallusia mammillata]
MFKHLRCYLCKISNFTQLDNISVRGISSVSIRMASSGTDRKPNRLINERSPYLLQHAHNPVDWYPWGEEAFAKAREESKLIFLSVGYSTCHWCHVMEKESFENESIAKILNEHFVPVKVDREERPDVDRVYMTFVQATSGQGGWPMSVWLTPELKPYIGGTYFPPDDSISRRGFRTVLGVIAKKWNDDKANCSTSASKIIEAIQKAIEVKTDSSASVPDMESCDKCAKQMSQNFDEELGGFGGAPKFPQPVNLNFLLRYFACHPGTDLGQKSLDMVCKTLKAMADGGIHDHIGYGFHRYSTDQYWHVPHFEKMLYDQGQIAVALADCYAITQDKQLNDALVKLLDYVCRDLTHPNGGFFSAEDADSLEHEDDSAKKEGAFYAWTQTEIQDILKDEKLDTVSLSDIVLEYYGVKDAGNVSFDQDPHGELRGKNVLIIRGGVNALSEKFKLPYDDVIAGLAKARDLMMRVREKRPRPHLDSKMITAWNALMISGFSRAACVTGETRYSEVATKAARFIREHLYDVTKQTLLRSCYCGEDNSVEQTKTPIEGFDADYAYLIRALLDLYEATHDDSWVEWASQLQEKQTELFWDDENGGFFTIAQGDSSILLRLKEDQDGAEPSANSVSAMNLLRLSAYLNQPNLEEQAQKLLKSFANRLSTVPYALPEMASALLWIWKGHKQIVIRGDAKNPQTQNLVKHVDANFLPFKIVIPPSINSSDSFLYRHLEGHLSGMTGPQVGVSEESRVFVCENFTCQLPVKTIDELSAVLK